MKRPARLRKLLVIGLLLVGVLLAAGLLAARLYLSSTRATQLVRHRLEETLGVPVELSSVHIGLQGESTFTGLQLREPEDDLPWLTAEQVSTDLSALGMARGQSMPGRIDLRQVHLRLRFDRQGNLLTRLPEWQGTGGPLPHVQLQDATLTLDQQGRQPFRLEGIALTLIPDGDASTVRGGVEDPTWGTFDVSGTKEPTGRWTVRLASQAATITPAGLRSLPFLPSSLWQQIEAEGKGIPVALQVSLNPEPFAVRYRVEFAQARIRLPQPDRPALVASPARAVLEGSDAGFRLNGDITDPTWGSWDVHARYLASAGQIVLDLRTRGQVAVDPAKLQALPYVPRVVWEQVQASGRTSARIRVRMIGDAVHYRVTLDPFVTQLHIAAIDLDAQRATGHVRVEDGRVWLENVTGQTAGGKLSLEGDLDFRGAVTRLDFAIRANRLALRGLPAKWELPRQIEGKITGQADVTVTLADGQVRTTGTGNGRIEEAKLAGFPTAEPIQLRLQSEGNRLRFQPRSALLESLIQVLGVSMLQPPLVDNNPLAPDRLAARAAEAASAIARQVARGAGETVALINRIERQLRAKETTYLDAKLTLTDVDLGELVRRLEVQLPIELEGRLSFQVEVGIPVNNARDLSLYRLQGNAVLARGRIGDLPLVRLETRVSFLRGLLRLDGVRGQVPHPVGAGTFAGAASARIAPRGDLHADLVFEQMPAEVVLGILTEGKQEITGPVSGKAEGRVPLTRLNELAAYRATAALQTRRLQIYGAVVADARVELALRRGSVAIENLSGMVNEARIDSLRATLAVTRDHVRLTDLHARLYRGEVTGSADLPLEGKAAGTVDLRIREVDAQAVTKAVAGLPLRLRGQVSGMVKATVQKGGVKGDIDLTATRLEIQNIPTQKLKGQVQYRDGKAEYRLTGETLGGTFSIEGKYPGVDTRSDGRFLLRDARLARLLAAWGRGQVPRGLRGTFSIDLPFRHGKDGIPTGRGRFVMRDLRWNDAELSDDLRGDVILDGGALTFRDVGGTLAGGLLRLAAAYRFRDPSRSWFTISLSRGESSRLVALVPGMEESVRGPVEVNLRGTLGPEWRGTGSLVFTRARVFGIEVDEWRLPIDFTFAPGQGRGDVIARESGARIGQGQARVRAEAHFNGGLRVDGSVLFSDAGLGSLAGLIGDLTGYVRGRVNGRVDFAGSNITSVNDLNANVQIGLRDGQAMQLPVFRALIPYLIPGQGSTVFHTGEMRGRLAGGVFRIGRLTLEGPLLELIAQGSVTVLGRLDLDVTARTSPLGGQGLLIRALALRLPPVGPIPVGLILRATQLLEDRVIHLRVTGTTRSPSVQVLPLRLLTDEAVRYFLYRTLLPAP